MNKSKNMNILKKYTESPLGKDFARKHIIILIEKLEGPKVEKVKINQIYHNIKTQRLDV
jgi:hypothetical protein